MKKLLIIWALPISIFLTGLHLLLNNLPSLGPYDWIRRGSDIIEIPAVLVGLLFSGNVHQPNELVTYAVLAAMYFMVIGALIWIGTLIRKTTI